jgi:hypothetical protein
MPTQRAIAKAKKDKREGKSASTQAGEFVREEMDEIRQGKHGARNPKQAIAIGLSEARRAGVNVPPAPRGSKSAGKKVSKASPHHKVSAKRSRATTNALKREPTSSASHAALSRQTKSAAAKRTARSRHEAAMKAARTRARNQHQAHHAHS